MLIRVPVLCLLLGLSLATGADQTDERLDDLFTTLQSSQDPLELMQTEAQIWEIWYQSGREDIDQWMSEAADLVNAGDLPAAELLYTRVIENLPQFSEGWNRRATVRYYRGDYDGSMEDIERTLRLEPRHFGAIWGLGMILGSKRDYQSAIEAFERLLEIKPSARDARPRIELLRQEMAKEAV